MCRHGKGQEDKGQLQAETDKAETLFEAVASSHDFSFLSTTDILQRTFSDVRWSYGLWPRDASLNLYHDCDNKGVSDATKCFWGTKTVPN